MSPSKNKDWETEKLRLCQVASKCILWLDPGSGYRCAKGRAETFGSLSQDVCKLRSSCLVVTRLGMWRWKKLSLWLRMGWSTLVYSACSHVVQERRERGRSKCDKMLIIDESKWRVWGCSSYRRCPPTGAPLTSVWVYRGGQATRMP